MALLQPEVKKKIEGDSINSFEFLIVTFSTSYSEKIKFSELSSHLYLNMPVACKHFPRVPSQFIFWDNMT